MDNKKPESIPYIAHEAVVDLLERRAAAEVEKSERRQRRSFAVMLLSIILLFASNALWLYNWTQYDYVSDTSTVQQDGSGRNISVIGDGNGQE